MGNAYPPCPPPQIEKSFKFDLYHTKGKFNRQQFDDIFFRKQGLIFHANSVFWNKSEKYFKMLYVDFFFFFFFFSSVQLASVIFYVIYLFIIYFRYRIFPTFLSLFIYLFICI